MFLKGQLPMRRYLLALAGCILAGACSHLPAARADSAPQPWRLAVHGGAGVITRAALSPDQEAAYHSKLAAALEAGAKVLRAGGTSLDAVEAAVLVMEDSALFNAGHGAVLTAAGTHELDASIMSGEARNAGAVAGVMRVRNPIRAARAVMERSEHVMFAGAGADAFAQSNGLEMVENSYFTTPQRQQALERVLETRARSAADRHGTVGAVAIDSNGHLAAATSTGGMTAKTPGRIGDSPLIGAATYAQDGVCAVSATGHGEYFIRVGVARTLCARAELLAEPIGDAARNALDQVAELGGDGGVVVIDGVGNVRFVFNSEGMYRGEIDAGSLRTAIYEEAPADGT